MYMFLANAPKENTDTLLNVIRVCIFVFIAILLIFNTGCSMVRTINAWRLDRYRNPTMDHESWLIVVKSKHFVYRAEAERPWMPEKVLKLLEGCYQEYYEMMGTGLKTFIEVEDRLCPSGKLSAVLSDGKAICEFPKEFGKIQNEWELAYHFFAHEVFHLWVGGYTVSHGEAIEALTQYMADRTLAKLGWIDYNRLTDGLKKRRINNTAIDCYYIRFYDLEAEKGEAVLQKLCNELAECFRAIFPTDESADVVPILNRYLGDIAI